MARSDSPAAWEGPTGADVRAAAALFRSTRFGLAEIDLASRRFVRVNDAMSVITGRTEAELLESPVDQLGHPDEVGTDPVGGDLAAAGTPFEFERRWVRKDGQAVWVHLIADVARDAAGRPARIHAVVADVTAQLETQQTLHRTAALLRAVSDATTDLLFVKDRSGRFVYANPATLAAMRVPEECLLGRAVSAVAADRAEALAVAANDERIMASGVAETVEEVYTTSAGTRIYASTKAPWRDDQGQVLGIVGVGRDVTEQRRSEAALRQAAAADAFRVALGDALRGLDDPAEVLDRAARLLSRELGSPTCGFREVEAELGLEGLDDARLEELRAGRTVGVEDTRTATSLLAVPMLRGERLAAALLVRGAAGRRWTPHELTLARATAEHAWSTVEHVRAERRERASAARFEALVDHAPLGIYLVDADFRLVQVNPVGLPIFAGVPGEVLGRDFDEILRAGWQAEYAVEVSRILRRTLETGEGFAVSELQEVRRDGENGRFYDWRADRIALPDGRHGVVCYYRDVTPQVRAREALQESEQRFRTMADEIPVLLWVTDPDGRVMFVNREYREFFGVTLEDAQRRGRQPFVHAETSEKGPFVARQRVRRADGASRWIQSFGRPRFSASGEFLGVAGISTDVTEAHEAEEAMREADRRKDEFLAVLSHELRNPLAPIRTSAHVLGRAVPTSEAAERARAVLDRQIGHLTRLVDDLLDVTRIARGKVQLRRERLDFAALVRETVEDHRDAFAVKSIALLAPTFRDELWIDGDSTRMRQVVGNLLQNAAKFTDPGGRVEVSLGVRHGRAVLGVEDDGIGIPPELLSTLFEPFIQADSTLARSHGGLGLGLALVRGLVELHGGEVEARSAGPGRGACLLLRLPLAVAPPSASEVGSTSPEVALRRVLVVEDNVDSAEMLSRVLELSGHRVEVAHTGADGLRRIEADAPDVVICDIGLPDVDGYEVARALTGKAERPFLIALTGYGLPDDVRRTTDAGFDRHLTKPPDLDALLRLVSEAPPRER